MAAFGPKAGALDDGPQAEPELADPATLAALATPVDSFLQDLGVDPSKEPVDLLLVVAVDVSGSISDGDRQAGSASDAQINEYKLQKDGIVAALRDHDVQATLEQCAKGGIGLTYVEWSGLGYYETEGQVRQVVPWRKISNGAELSSFADAVQRARRSFWNWTDVITALAESARLIVNAPFRSERNLINISSDGNQSEERGPEFIAPGSVRHDLLAATSARIGASGIVVNSLVIGNDPRYPWLERYYRERVQGGPGAFTMSVDDFYGYAETFKANLLRELRICPS